MFTGLIETTGQITSINKKSDVWLVTITPKKSFTDLKLGDSVAVMGVCCTVVSKNDSSFSVEIMQETINVTKFKNIKTGDRVNLERAMLASSRLDGHIVTGHVDGLAYLKEIKILGNTRMLYFSSEENILSGIVHKGSVTIDGTSLTVVDSTDTYFSVSLIPTTLKETTLLDLHESDSVNIETDILGKYICKFLDKRNNPNGENISGQLTYDNLIEYGW